jgi:hypothetical protein
MSRVKTSGRNIELSIIGVKMVRNGRIRKNLRKRSSVETEK